MEENSKEILDELIAIRKGLTDLRVMFFIVLVVIVGSIAWLIANY
tara:strand:+ start:118 stop:252 length:135 start_codon:yes stop_codon:yes gene_type:complete